MKYFCRDHERAGSCYHEFQRGKWDGRTFWKADSINIHDDVMIGIGLDALLAQCVCGYDPWGPTMVSAESWAAVLKNAEQTGGPVTEAVKEADEWVRAGDMQAFTILGI